MGLLSKSKLKFKTCFNLQWGRGWTTPCLGRSFTRLGPTVQGQGQEGAGKTVGEIVKSARFLWSPGGSGEINFIMKVKICMNNNRFWSAWKCKNVIVCMSLCTAGLPVRKMGTVFLQFVDIGWQRKQMEAVDYKRTSARAWIMMLIGYCERNVWFLKIAGLVMLKLILRRKNLSRTWITESCP